MKEDLPVRKFEFNIFPVECDVFQLKSFLYDELGTGVGFFIAGKFPDEGYDKKPLKENLFISKFEDSPAEAYEYMEEENSESAREILHYGRIMVAWVDEETENIIELEERLASDEVALAFIFGKYSKELTEVYPTEYTGPEMVYELVFLDGEDQKEVCRYKFIIYKSQNEEWEVKELN